MTSPLSFISFVRIISVPIQHDAMYSWFQTSSKGLRSNLHLSAIKIAPFCWILPFRPQSEAPFPTLDVVEETWTHLILMSIALLELVQFVEWRRTITEFSNGKFVLRVVVSCKLSSPMLWP